VAVVDEQPRVVLLDEATSAVDSATEQMIQLAFRRLSAGRTTFVVAHRLSTIMAADAILVVDRGEIVERGTHEELLLKGGKYWELWTKQTLGNSGAPSSDAGEGKAGEQAAAALVNDLPAGAYTQELNRAFGVGAQQADEPPLVAVTSANDETNVNASDAVKAAGQVGVTASGQAENEDGSKKDEETNAIDPQ